MSKNESAEWEYHFIDDTKRIAIIACGEPNEEQGTSAMRLGENCFRNGLCPEIFFFSPHTTQCLTNKKFLSKYGYPMNYCGSTPSACLEVIQRLGEHGNRTWLGIAPLVPETYDVTREGILYLWKQRPKRDIIYVNMPMADALTNWAYDHMHLTKVVVVRTMDEKILYSDKVRVISEEETLDATLLE